MGTDPTVFVVDDDPGARRSMRWLLESEGLPVEAFASARDFLASYEPTRPGCLLLDLRMPEVDGLELQRKLVSHGAQIPIIFVSGHGDISKCVAAMQSGAVDFLEKPVDDNALIARVRQALRGDFERRQIECDEPEFTSRIDSLTSRERDVMRLVFAGKSIKQIAVELDIGYQTAAKHRASILRKLDVENEAELVRLLVHHEYHQQ